MTVIIGLIIQMFIIQPLLYTMLTRKNPFIFMKGLIQVWLTALVTSSSAATLPVTIQCCEQNLNIDKRISRFVLPVGATVNMNGAALYEAVSAIFVAQLVGWELNAARLLVVGLTATFGSIGAAAVPSAGVVTLVIVLNALGLGTQHMAMFIAVDWFIDRVRTSVNVIGDAYAAGVVQHYCTKVLEQMDGDGSKTGSSDTVTHTSTEKTDEDRNDGTITASNSGQEDSSEGDLFIFTSTIKQNN
ncbi:unnamed protein product [Toxocara canis]|nr:unnamed protein product [Toxocara canis]